MLDKRAERKRKAAEDGGETVVKDGNPQSEPKAAPSPSKPERPERPTKKRKQVEQIGEGSKKQLAGVLGSIF